MTKSVPVVELVGLLTLPKDNQSWLRWEINRTVEKAGRYEIPAMLPVILVPIHVLLPDLLEQVEDNWDEKDWLLMQDYSVLRTPPPPPLVSWEGGRRASIHEGFHRVMVQAEAGAAFVKCVGVLQLADLLKEQLCPTQPSTPLMAGNCPYKEDSSPQGSRSMRKPRSPSEHSAESRCLNEQ